mmetsp:Transcript_15774/g.17987  ORF Transcript_15774/g.17987 Transcript_15774/m.17987 type:complete len:285 (+) Transcript_15774:148-1002(+)
MVVISIKQADGDGFLYETTTETQNNDLIKSLVEIHNERLRARVIVDGCRALALYGPMKHQSQVGSDEVKEKYMNEKIEKGPNYQTDPTGIRIGNPPEGNLRDTLERVAKDLEEYIDKSQLKKRIALDHACIMDKIANVRGAVMMSYPMGLPEWDVVKMSLDSIDGVKGTAVEIQLLDPESTSLWAAGKEFQRGNLVSDRLGKNEKTKVIAKLQKKGSGPPGREPIVNEEERNAMMAHYFKRQEELKRLSQADDDDYLNSEWADTKQMKRSLQGVTSIKAPGFKF